MKQFCLNFGNFKKKKNEENFDNHKIDDDTNETKVQIEDATDKRILEALEIRNIFRPLQFVVACFGSLNRGANDVGNCIGPLVIIWFIYNKPLEKLEENSSYIWLAWGGLGISLGMFLFGKKVIVTMGSKVTTMTPSLGFVVVLSASLVVMLCSLFGIPTSTTHCQVMALVGAGIARGFVDTNSIKGGLYTIDLKVFKNILLSWICTIPCSIALSASMYAGLRMYFIGPFHFEIH